MAPDHLGGGLAELDLDMALVDLCPTRESGAQGVAGEQRETLALGQVAAKACRAAARFTSSATGVVALRGVPDRRSALA